MSRDAVPSPVENHLLRNYTEWFVARQRTARRGRGNESCSSARRNSGLDFRLRNNSKRGRCSVEVHSGRAGQTIPEDDHARPGLAGTKTCLDERAKPRRQTEGGAASIGAVRIGAAGESRSVELPVRRLDQAFVGTGAVSTARLRTEVIECGKYAGRRD